MTTDDMIVWSDPLTVPGSDYVIAQLSEEDVEGWSDWKRKQAKRAGRLARLQGVPPEWANRTPEALDVRLPPPGTAWGAEDLLLAYAYEQWHRIALARGRGDLDAEGLLPALRAYAVEVVR